MLLLQELSLLLLLLLPRPLAIAAVRICRTRSLSSACFATPVVVVLHGLMRCGSVLILQGRQASKVNWSSLHVHLLA